MRVPDSTMSEIGDTHRFIAVTESPGHHFDSDNRISSWVSWIDIAKRPHQGRNMGGKTPYDMFVKGLPKKHKSGTGKSAANAA